MRVDIHLDQFCVLNSTNKDVVNSTINIIKFYKNMLDTMRLKTYMIMHIGSNAFSKYNNPETVIIPEGVTTIEYHAFSECSNLTSITIPSTLKSIGSEAFWLCIQLSKINLPEGIEHVEHDAFLCCGCSTFKIIIPKGTKAYFKTLLSDFEHEKLQEQSESEKP